MRVARQSRFHRILGGMSRAGGFFPDRAKLLAGSAVSRAGLLEIDAAPHHLVADTPILTHRRTRAGDHFEQGRMPKTPPIGVGLGLPKIGVPEPLPTQMGCDA